MIAPLTDQIRMDTGLAGDLRDCFLPINRFQGDLGLEGRVVSLGPQNVLILPLQLLGRDS